MTKTNVREQCQPAEADWFVNVSIGKTFCPMADEEHACPHRDEGTRAHDEQYGTDTSYEYGYWSGERPTEAEVASLIPAGWYEIEHTIKRCPNPGDESVCRWCSDPIEFAVDGDTRWGRTDGEDPVTFCGANPEDDRHEPEDEFNE